MIGKANAEHYTWGDGCDGWYLVKSDELTIIQERMPAGTAEVLHRHRKSRQFFYVLSGSALMEHNNKQCILQAGEGIEIAPGVAHQIRNEGTSPLEILVTSHPPSHGDRVNLSPVTPNPKR
jgi:mannose-6-phosphate isomerase-like protein (cupin superfamily)